VPGRPLILFNVWDAGSSATVIKAGARAIATSSWAVAAANGARDGENLSRALAMANLARIVEATSLPVSVDLEAGYGTVTDVGNTVLCAISAGAVGCNLEDSEPAGRRLRDRSAQTARLRRARRVSETTGVRYFINARTDVFLEHEVEGRDEALATEAIERARAYADAVADGIFVPGLVDVKVIARVVQMSPIPVNAMITDESVSVSTLAQVGVSRVSFGALPYVIAMRALERAAEHAFTQTADRARV